MNGVHVRTLQRALEIVVRKEELAAALDLSLPDLEACLAGKKLLPNSALITALDIVARGKRA